MIKVITSAHNGFCPGVKKAVDLAKQNASPSTYCLGQLSHNERVVSGLKDLGIKFVDTVEEIAGAESDTPVKVIIRSHGEPKETYDKLKGLNAEIIDATCGAVKRIHKIVKEKDALGYKIIIAGDKNHPEVKGICGWCKDATVISDENCPLIDVPNDKNICVVSQTTLESQKYTAILEKIKKHGLKTVEIFDTICYTTFARQEAAEKIARKSDLVLVLGSKQSSNTQKLLERAQRCCKGNNAVLVSSLDDIKNIEFMPDMTVGVISGASTPKESVMEVVDYMSQNVGEISVSEELKAGVEESLMDYREGKRVKGTVISADEKGIRVNIGGKYDGIVYAAESGIEQNYDPAAYTAGSEIEAMIIGKKDSDTDCILLSKKKIDLIKEGDKVIESIRGGEVFEIIATSAATGGLLGKLGTYTIFVPSSHIKEKGFPKDLSTYVKKRLRLTVLEIDDVKRKIVASQKKILVAEREEREAIFWQHVVPNVIVSGTVKRITNFGAFVSVDNFDCLAHIGDLSWTHIKTVEEVLEKDKAYDFLVLSVDKEKGRVSLGYKQLQPHPYVVALQKHPVGSICKGKVVSIVPFGAFVQIEQGLEGLVHVSEASHNYIKNVNEVLKVGDEVDVMVLAIDEQNRKITLSIKACTTEEASAEEAVESAETTKKGGKGKSKDAKPSKSGDKEWSEDHALNPFADLLKDMDVK